MTRPLRKEPASAGAGPQVRGNAALRAVDPSRNRKATPEEVRKANDEVRALFLGIGQKDLLPAADFIRAMDPPPSAEAIALLGFRMIELHEKLRQSYASRRPRNRDLLTPELRAILADKPLASTDEVIEALRARAGPGLPIDDVSDDGTVSWAGGEASKRNIAQRISRSRPKAR